MESFEEIRKNDIENLTGELSELAKELVEEGISRKT